MSKTDFKKELRTLYQPSARDFVVVDVPPMKFLMIDGHGDPNTAQEYADALETLYAVAYKSKFASKKKLERDYVVPRRRPGWGGRKRRPDGRRRKRSDRRRHRRRHALRRRG